jgi:MiaB-like tRNA modifying enzyme
MKVYLESYGCTLNRGEAGLIEDSLINRGFEVVNEPQNADRIIIATCAVIQATENHMMKRISELLAFSKETYVTGCLASYKDREILALGAIPVKKLDFEDVINDSLGCRKRQTVASVPISTGCVGRCSYCVTRSIRGGLRSYEPDLILKKVKELVESGVKEIRITAQDAACYGFERKDVLLPDLIDDLVAIEGDFMVRIGMMAPGSFLRIEEDMLRAFSKEKVYKFLHLPVQSADDDILLSMHRGYTYDDYLSAVRRARVSLGRCTLSTDVIIGYPGEDWESFMKTYRAIQSIKPDIVNVTRFSARDGTEAFMMENVPIGRSVKARSRMMTKLARDIALENNRALVGEVFRSLVCEQVKDGTVMARSEAYKPLVVPATELGKFISIRAVKAKSAYLMGEVV